MTDDLVVSFKDSSIYESDVQILKSNTQWLNDSIISFRIEYLVDTLLVNGDNGNGNGSSISNNNQLNKEIAVLSPSVIFLCSFVESDQEVQMILESLNLKSKQLVFIPLNNNKNPNVIGGGSHWSLLVFVKQLNQFLYYDSMNRFDTQDALFVISKFKFLLSSPTNNLKDYIKTQHTPQQTNSHDCGLYSLAMIEELLNIIIKCKKEQPETTFSDVLLSKSTNQTLLNIITPSYIKDKRSEILNLIYTLKNNK